MTDTNAEIMKDSAMEWRLLNKLLLPENRDFINRFAPALFTGNRIEVHRAMQLCFTEYGTITYEGIYHFMNGKVPGELTAANGGDLQTLFKQLTRLATKRQLKERAKLLDKLGDEFDPDLNDVQKALDFEPITGDEDSTLALGAQSMLGDLHAKLKGDYIFARTGFNFLDRHLGGEYKPKGLLIWAGGVGSGKTTLWINSQKKMAQGYTSKFGERIHTASLFFSLEMSKADLLVKMAADELEINTTDILAADFDRILLDKPNWHDESDVMSALEDKIAELQQLPMFIIENGRITLPQMVYEIRKHVYKHGVRVVCIDYLQLVNHHPTGNKNNDLGEFAIAMKEIAKRENITIIILSQVNRAGENVDVIRDSGEVQAVADVIIQLIPDDEEMTGSDPFKSVQIGWWKNRYGPAGRKNTIALHGAYQRFIEG
jgi:replicative DNA helicase